MDVPIEMFAFQLIRTPWKRAFLPLLAIGVIVAYWCLRKHIAKPFSQIIVEAADSAGLIILITGAGGAFGSIINASGIGQYLVDAMSTLNIPVVVLGYVRYGDALVPAAETEFAKDKTFGYSKSDLTEYVEEKTSGAYKAEDVIAISLADLRGMNFDAIENQLMQAHDFQKIIVNAIDYDDIKAFCIPLYRAIAKGKHFIFRTAAALVKVMGGISTIPLLKREQMITKPSRNGCMIVVGSHTQKTTAHLKRLLQMPGVKAIEFNSDLVLEGDEALQKEVDRVVAESEKLIEQGITPVCYTKRKLLSLENDSKENALLRSVKISNAVQSLVANLRVTPAFVIAKGGITSSDVGVKALHVKRANMLGQIRPGIPVWQTDAASKFPEIPYVIFPGNVGEENTLAEAAAILVGHAEKDK